MILDGLRNLVSNLGTSRDKAFGAEYAFVSLSDAQLSQAWRSSWLAQKIVNLPAHESVREWREWQAEADQISRIEAEEARLGLVQKVRQARVLARLYGGAAIYIGTGDSDPTLPMDVGSVRAGGIQFLAVLPKLKLSAQTMQNDPTLPGYGRPSMYKMGSDTIVHPSRLVIFDGVHLPDPDMTSDGWGDSVLQATMDAVKAHDSVSANILSLTYEAKIDVVKIPDFTESLRSGGSAYEQNMLARWQLAMTGKGINGALMIDAAEEYEQKTMTFAGLPDIWDRFMVSVSGASDIPMTRLFGRAPAGMNATGESDTRNFYDMIKAQQSGEMQPAMAVLDECLVRSALGERPEEIHFNWKSLHQPDAKDRAEVADKITTAFERVHRMDGLIPEEALGRAVVNALTESGVAPGLEADVAEFFAGQGEGDQE